MKFEEKKIGNLEEKTLDIEKIWKFWKIFQKFGNLKMEVEIWKEIGNLKKIWKFRKKFGNFEKNLEIWKLGKKFENLEKKIGN